jgi:hypothetical protein
MAFTWLRVQAQSVYAFDRQPIDTGRSRTSTVATGRTQASSWCVRALPQHSCCARHGHVSLRRAEKQVANDDVRLKKCERVLEVLEKEIARDIERETGAPVPGCVGSMPLPCRYNSPAFAPCACSFAGVCRIEACIIEGASEARACRSC